MKRRVACVLVGAMVLAGAALAQVAPPAPSIPEPPAKASAPDAAPPGEDGESRAATGGQSLGAAPNATHQVLEPGDEPRDYRRYAPRPGTFERVEVTTRTKTRRTVNGEERASDLGVTVTLRAEVTAIRIGGDIEASIEIEDANWLSDGKPTEDESLRQHMQLLKGLKGTMVIAPNGAPKETKLALPKGSPRPAVRATQAVRRMLSQLRAPMPREAIGSNARWASLDAGGVLAPKESDRMVFTCGVIGPEGTTIRSSVDRELDSRGAMRRAHVTASGEYVALFARIFPARSSTEVVTSMSLSAEGAAGGEGGALDMRTETHESSTLKLTETGDVPPKPATAPEAPAPGASGPESPEAAGSPK